MKGNTQADIDNRTVEKIQITITVDKPTPFPMMHTENLAKGKWGEKSVIIDRNQSGGLLLVHTVEGDVEQEVTTSYVVSLKAIAEGIVAHEEQSA